MRRWLLPGILALLAASSSAAVALGGRTGDGDAPQPGPRVPVLSLRRVPGVVSQVVADSRLRSSLDAALANPALANGRQRSCLVVRQGGRPIHERRPNERLIPASTLKLVTGHAVLVKLGPGERFVTEVRAGGPMAAGGVLQGPLWLVGGGDPLLATADYAASFPYQPQLYTAMEALADRVVAAGVRQVTGGVVADESRYDTQRYLPSWRSAYVTGGHVGPASALTVNDGFAQVGAARVASPQPQLNAAGVFTALLRVRGVTVAGVPGAGVAPVGASVVARVDSPPLGDVVGEMLRDSQNLTAELLVKELGRRFGQGGSTAAGLAVAREALQSAGLPVGELVAVDGSGLDRSDRASCALLMAVLEAAGQAGPLAHGLPVAARTGTLAMRFHGNPAAGRLRAKTGSLENVTGLAGYMDVNGEGPDLGFALIANDVPTEAMSRALQEQVGAVLARYPEAPSPAVLGP